MKKSTKIIIATVVVIAIIAVIVAVVLMNQKPKTNLPAVNSAEDLTALINKVYEGQDNNTLPALATQTIDVTDNTLVKAFTGLENGNDLQYLAVSEPMMSSRAYSFVLAKVKDGVNANEIAKQMSEKIDTRKWICVSAEKLYATNSANIVCLVMSDEETAKPIYEKFKTLAGTIGQEYEQTEEIELPPDTLPSEALAPETVPSEAVPSDVLQPEVH